MKGAGRRKRKPCRLNGAATVERPARVSKAGLDRAVEAATEATSSWVRNIIRCTSHHFRKCQFKGGHQRSHTWVTRILDFYKLLRVRHHRHLSLQLSRQLPLDLQGRFKAIATTAMFMGTRLQTAAKSNLFKFTVGIYMETLTLLSTVYVL